MTASETNAAGLTGSASLSFTYDTVAPVVKMTLADDTGGTNNVTSNDALTGSADANAMVTLSEGATVLGTTTANASGNWSFTPTGLAQGLQTVTASETNAAGLTGSASLTFTYDTVAPVVKIALAHDTGGTNNVTSNDALTGSADANAAVTLTEGSTVLGTTTANASGVWSFTPTGLAQGLQTVTASETNAAGLTGSASLTFTYDTVAPVVTMALAHDTGGTNNVTSNDALTGSADANAKVTLSEGAKLLGTTTANASGAWSFTPTGLAQGLQTVTASETNAAGLTGSASLTFTYDTVAPVVKIALAHDTGGTNNVTSNDALTGSADANATVTLSEGAKLLGTTTANASGAWSFTPTGLAQGLQTVTASETNAAGLTGSASLTFTYDTVAPVVKIALAHDTGGTNNVTSNDALTGSADANATVTLSEGAKLLGTTTANASGAWSFTPTGLAQGLQTVTASETNAAGLTGSASLTFTYDTVAPVVKLTLADDTGGTNNITSNDALTGSADANALVTLTEGTTVLGTTTANALGVWSFTPTGLAQGLQTVTASETNTAGLTGSASLSFTYDTVAPVVTMALLDDTGGTNNVTSNDVLTGNADANATVTLSEGTMVLGSTTANACGNWTFTPTGLAQGLQTVTASETNAAGLTGSASLSFTYDTVAPVVTMALLDDTGGTNNVTSNDVLTGNADANAVVTFLEGTMVLGSTTANASGVWSFTPSGLAQGLQTVTASETNAAGLTGSASLSFTYDTVAPTVTMALLDDTGGTNNVTSNDVLTGIADANAVVMLLEGTTLLGSTIANGSGEWSFTPSGLAQGLQTVTASETNAAGLTGSASLTFTYDTVPPAMSMHLNGESGTWSIDPALSGTTDPNMVVTLTEGATVLGTTTANASGVWSFVPTGLPQGAQTIVASATDLAGNTGTSALTFSLSTVASTNGSMATWAYNADGTVNNVHYYDIAHQPYTDYDVAYGANNQPASALYSDGMTESWTYNSDGTSAVALNNIPGQISGSSLSETSIYDPNFSGANHLAASEFASTPGSETLTANESGMTIAAGSGGVTVTLAGPSGDSFNFAFNPNMAIGGSGLNENIDLNPGFGNVTVSNFLANGDTIAFGHGLFENFADLQNHMTQNSVGTVITDDQGDHVTLSHVAMAALQAHSFLIG